MLVSGLVPLFLSTPIAASAPLPPFSLAFHFRFPLSTFSPYFHLRRPSRRVAPPRPAPGPADGNLHKVDRIHPADFIAVLYWISLRRRQPWLSIRIFVDSSGRPQHAPASIPDRFIDRGALEDTRFGCHCASQYDSRFFRCLRAEHGIRGGLRLFLAVRIARESTRLLPETEDRGNKRSQAIFSLNILTNYGKRTFLSSKTSRSSIN